jgi:hypothetical protein
MSPHPPTISQSIKDLQQDIPVQTEVIHSASDTKENSEVTELKKVVVDKPKRAASKKPTIIEESEESDYAEEEEQ